MGVRVLAAWASVRVCGCGCWRGVWACGFVGARVCGCMKKWACGCGCVCFLKKIFEILYFVFFQKKN